MWCPYTAKQALKHNTEAVFPDFFVCKAGTLFFCHVVDIKTSVHRALFTLRITKENKARFSRLTKTACDCCSSRLNVCLFSMILSLFCFLRVITINMFW